LRPPAKNERQVGVMWIFGFPMRHQT
jgi:hypothetical protein